MRRGLGASQADEAHLHVDRPSRIAICRPRVGKEVPAQLDGLVSDRSVGGCRQLEAADRIDEGHRCLEKLGPRVLQTGGHGALPQLVGELPERFEPAIGLGLELVWGDLS